jgi:formamidopyrimidine-DNA glycosylase
MAELPDLTVFAQILNRRFQGRQLERLEITVAKKLNVSEAALKSALEGRELSNVRREGKTLQLHFSGAQVLGLHLMLRGELASLEHDEKPKYQIMAFHFKGGEGFAVTDRQKQATPTLHPKQAKAPDALAMEESYFKSLLAKKRTVIKTLLMDQQAMRGIGNSYADEILYDAGLSPFAIAHAIPPQKAGELFHSIHTVLERAITDIAGANGDELKGELRDFLSVHVPHLDETANGEVIRTDKIGGRRTYFTDTQKRYGS